MLRRATVFALCALVVSLIAARPAVAQRVSLSPTIGVYIPTTELIKAANGQEFKQEVGVSVGGRLGVTLSPRFGIETTVNYVPSNLRFTFDGNETTTDANLLFGSARASFHAIPMTQPVWLTLNGGVSVIKRSGEAYENLDDDTDVGGVVGATLGFRLGSMLSFYVAAEDYIYGRKIDETTLDADAKTQNDVQISLGLGFPVGR
jgi:outer membrane protein with beta-barrel domain